MHFNNIFWQDPSKQVYINMSKSPQIYNLLKVKLSYLGQVVVLQFSDL